MRNFVRTWRIAAAVDWTDRTTFPPVDADRLKAIVDEAAKTEATTARTAFVELGPRFPDKVNRVAGYAVRTVAVDRRRTVKVLAGGADALRVWVNGRPVIENLKRRPAKKD
jgi:hypothetical protein